MTWIFSFRLGLVDGETKREDRLIDDVLAGQPVEFNEDASRGRKHFCISRLERRGGAKPFIEKLRRCFLAK